MWTRWHTTRCMPCSGVTCCRIGPPIIRVVCARVVSPSTREPMASVGWSGRGRVPIVSGRVRFMGVVRVHVKQGDHLRRRECIYGTETNRSLPCPPMPMPHPYTIRSLICVVATHATHSPARLVKDHATHAHHADTQKGKRHAPHPMALFPHACKVVCHGCGRPTCMLLSFAPGCPVLQKQTFARRRLH